jgi:hypothetical protein
MTRFVRGHYGERQRNRAGMRRVYARTVSVALTTDHESVIHRDVSTGRHIRIGRLLASELARWR